MPRISASADSSPVRVSIPRGSAPLRRATLAAALSAATLIGACGGGETPDRGASSASMSGLPEGAEAISFLGEALYAPELSEAAREVYEARYAEAEDALVAAPEDVDALIWMGRRTAYMGRYRAAIDVFTHAVDLHPDDARIYRHRGHRYLTVRDPANAIPDFERAAELTEGQPDQIEPDGLPNAMNTPTSTLQFNIWYHLALAHYVQGHLEAALEAQRRALDVSDHADSVIGASYWMYITMIRLGMDEEAEAVLAGISPDMDIIESGGYLDLLLLFKGERTLEDVVGPAGTGATLASTTTAYGIGAWHLLNGRAEEAHEVWERIMMSENQWAAFGYLAAEGELARSAVR